MRNNLTAVLTGLLLLMGGTLVGDALFGFGLTFAIGAGLVIQAHPGAGALAVRSGHSLSFLTRCRVVSRRPDDLLNGSHPPAWVPVESIADPRNGWPRTAVGCVPVGVNAARGGVHE